MSQHHKNTYWGSITWSQNWNPKDHSHIMDDNATFSTYQTKWIDKLLHASWYFLFISQNWHSSIFGQTTYPKLKGMSTCGGQKQQHNNHNFKRLYSMFVNHHICVDLWSSVHHIDSWNCPKFMHKSKYA